MPRLAICSRRSTAGSRKASTHPIFKRQRHCSKGSTHSPWPSQVRRQPRSGTGTEETIDRVGGLVGLLVKLTPANNRRISAVDPFRASTGKVEPRVVVTLTADRRGLFGIGWLIGAHCQRAGARDCTTGDAAIDYQLGARDIARRTRTQEQHAIGDVLRLADSAER